MKATDTMIPNTHHQHMLMKGCLFFHGDIEQNNCYFSKNAVDIFYVENAEKDCIEFFRNALNANDFYLFQKFFYSNRAQICGDFEFKTKDEESIIMRCILQREDIRCNTLFSGVLTELSLSYATKSVTRLKEKSAFRTALHNICKEPRECGIMIVGIDRFKDINELHSYEIGDEVLTLFARKIGDSIRDDVSLYQLDCDCFGILYPQAHLDDLTTCFEDIQHCASALQLSNGITISFTISGGFAMYPKDGAKGEMLYRNARVAFNEAKERGKNQFVIYDDEMSTRATYLARLMESLRESIHNNFEGFCLNYQPLVYASNGELFGCEALLRWKHEKFPNGLSPTEFIPVLEQSGLIIEVGNWVIKQAFEQKMEWDKINPHLQMNINVAAGQFRQSNFMNYTMDMISKYHLNPKTITLELTESGEITDTAEINRVFDFFRSQHIKIALDDFGTGYDSLSCLRLLSSDVLKIDRSFLERITYNIADQKILYHIINLCKSMMIDVCIEGIETDQVRDITREYGAKLLQGFYYSEPVDAKEFTSYIIAHQQQPLPIQEEMNTQYAMNQSLVYSDVKPAQAMNMNELIDQAYGGIFQVGMDHEFTFLTCNEGYRRMLGYTASEIDEKFKNKALGFVHPDDVEYVNNEVRRQLSIGDTLHSSEFRVVKKDGSSIWVVGTGSVVRSYKRNPSLVVMIVENDSAKKKYLGYEKAYHQYQTILHNIPGGIKCVRFDEFFTIDYISPSLLSILGYTQEDVITYFDSKYSNMVYEEDVVKVTGDVVEQLKSDSTVHLRYRSYCKNGSLVWLETTSRLYPPDKDGIQRFYSSVINITNTLTENDKTRTSSFKERFQQASRRWGDILFEIDLTTQYISFSENFKQLFGRTLVHKLDESYAFVHPDDRRILKKAIEQVKSQHDIITVEVRIMNGAKHYIWCSLIFHEPEYINDKPSLLFGKLCNIEKEKKEREELIQKSQQDSSTGLLNKGAIEAKIRSLILYSDQLYALFMMDIDDFKTINDSYGHLFGDKLLGEISKRLKETFDFDCTIGRVGGDEFMIFMPYSGNLREVEIKAERLLNVLHSPFTYDAHTHITNISIGISCFPKDGNSFYELFKNADSALYRVKQQDKNNYCFY